MKNAQWTGNIHPSSNFGPVRSPKALCHHADTFAKKILGLREEKLTINF